MAKITGAIQFEGTIGNVTCYKTKDGYIAKIKSSPKEIKNDRTKENMQEFARAAHATKLVRKTFADIMGKIKDFYLHRRLSGEMARVLRSDTVNPRGFRNIADGDIELLQGFDVNTDMALSTAFKAPIAASIDRVTGVLKVEFPALVTASLLAYPKGASHFKLTIAGASIDFSTGDHLVAQKDGEQLLLSKDGITVPSLEVQLPPAGTAPLILALGISFYQEVNGSFSLLGKGLFNAVAFVAVSRS